MNDSLIRRALLSPIRNESLDYTGLGKEIEEIFKESNQLKISQIVFSRIKHTNESVKKQLEAQKLFYAKRYLLQKSEIINIAKILNSSQINHVFLKGAHLNKAIYKEKFLRPMSDVDLIVAEDTSIFAANELIKNGYRFLVNNKLKIDNFKFTDTHQLPVIKSPSGILVDLHFRISHPHIAERCKLSTYILKHPEIYESINYPDLKASIIHMSYHFFRHSKMNSGLINLFDLIKLQEKIGISKNELTEFAENVGLRLDFEESTNLIEYIQNRGINQKYENYLQVALQGERLAGFGLKKKSRRNFAHYFDNYLGTPKFNFQYVAGFFNLFYYSTKKLLETFFLKLKYRKFWKLKNKINFYD